MIVFLQLWYRLHLNSKYGYLPLPTVRVFLAAIEHVMGGGNPHLARRIIGMSAVLPLFCALDNGKAVDKGVLNHPPNFIEITIHFLNSTHKNIPLASTPQIWNLSMALNG